MSCNSVEKYIENKYRDYIFSKILKFYNEIKSHLDMHTYAVPYPTFITLDEITVEKVYFKDDIFGKNLEFKLVVRADFILKGDRFNDYETDTLYRKFTVTGTGILNNGISKFYISDVEEYINQAYQYKHALSAFAIPYISTDDLEYRAEEFLTKHCKEALEEPMQLPLNKILINMNVTVFHAPLGKRIFGKTFFAQSTEKIYNDDNEVEDKQIYERTILIDPDVFFFRNIGTYNNTVIHECIHVEYHSNYFELQKLINSSLKSIACKVNKGSKQLNTNEQKALDFMEWQASMLAPRILMPAKTTKIKYQQLISEINQDFPSYLKGKKMEILIDRLAEFFQVSKQAAKIRLIDLGVDAAAGVQNYVNGKKIPSFAFKSHSLNRNQTFIIDFKDSVKEIKVNQTLNSLSIEGKLAYINGMVVLNLPKYVIKDDFGNKVLTNYALEHVDECAFVFTKDTSPNKNTYSEYLDTMCFLCRPESKDDYVSGNYDRTSTSNRQLENAGISFLDELDDIHNAKALLKKMNGEFAEDFLTVVTELGYLKSDGIPNYYAISKLTSVTDHTIKNYLDGTSTPQKEKLIAICGGLCLHTKVAYKLLEKANLTILNSMNETDLTYCALIERHYDEGLEKWNEYLSEANFNQLP